MVQSKIFLSVTFFLVKFVGKMTFGEIENDKSEQMRRDHCVSYSFCVES